MHDSSAQSKCQTDTALINQLESKYAGIMAEYCAWRRSETDHHMLMEDFAYRQELDRCRREIASAKAPVTDVVSKMRLLDNWLETASGGGWLTFDTPHGCYKLAESDVTHVWLVKTPDGKLEGPFPDAQEAADWAADDWEAILSDEEPEADWSEAS